MLTDRNRTLYEGIALVLALTPFFFTALLSIFLVLRYWKRPGSALRQSRSRHVIAFVLALLQILGWISLVVMAILEK